MTGGRQMGLSLCECAKNRELTEQMDTCIWIPPPCHYSLSSWHLCLCPQPNILTSIYSTLSLSALFLSGWSVTALISTTQVALMLKRLDTSLSIKPWACDPCEYRKSVPLKVLPPPSHSQPPFSHVPILYLLSHSWFLVPSSWDLAMCVCLCVCKDVWLYLAPSQHFQAVLMPLASSSS